MGQWGLFMGQMIGDVSAWVRRRLAVERPSVLVACPPEDVHGGASHMGVTFWEKDHSGCHPAILQPRHGALLESQVLFSQRSTVPLRWKDAREGDLPEHVPQEGPSLSYFPSPTIPRFPWQPSDKPSPPPPA